MPRLAIGITAGVLGLLLLLFTIQNYFGSMGELEPGAANMFLIVAGVPGLILVIVSSLLLYSHSKRSRRIPYTTLASAMFCRSCGNPLAAGAIFCAKCGHKVQT